MNPQQLITACESTIKMQMVEIDKLRDEIKQLVEWINGDRDALTCHFEANRVKAAAAAIGFERPKMTVNVRVGPGVLGDRLDQAKTVNPPLIEHQG